MNNRIFARTNDEETISKLINLLGNDKGILQFEIDYQAKTESFVFDIKTDSAECAKRINGYIRQAGIDDTKSVGIIGGK